MAKIAILNDSPEVVALLGHFITQGRHEFLNRIGANDRMIAGVVDFVPDLIVVPIHRVPASIDRPIGDVDADIYGLSIFRLVMNEPALDGVPVIVFGFYVRETDMPPDIRDSGRYKSFLEFPLGLQELNPLISGTVGPAEGSLEDVKRVRDF
jgi:hypothetical protein